MKYDWWIKKAGLETRPKSRLSALFEHSEEELRNEDDGARRAERLLSEFFFATPALRSGAALLNVKVALRHSSIKTTQRYLHNLERIKKGGERQIEF